MANLIYPRLISASRSAKVNDTANGARMQSASIMQNVAASIQPKRDRNVTPASNPTGVGTVSADAMTTWLLLCKPPVPFLKNDLVTDDLGVVYTVESVYPTAMGSACIMRITSP